MKSYYPIALKVEGANVLVIGGGNVGTRKVKTLLASGAKVKVVSPLITGQLRRLYKAGKISYTKRKYKSSDLASAVLAIAATNDEKTNALVSKDARQKGILVNVVDNAKLSDFISPALLSRGRAIIAVYTDGREPVLSRDLKNFLKEHWNEFLSYRSKLQKREY
jgi:siroheme synthase-like protein